VPNIGFAADVDANMWVSVMFVLELMLQAMLLLFCSTAFRCRPITISGCRALQAWMPSCHVCWNAVLPVAPQFPNQEPPRAQQLSLPDLLMVPHARHMGPAVVVGANVQASTPSNQLWSNFVLPTLPQFLYQLPPGAQQLTRPDFLNAPHFGHTRIAEAIGVLAICHLASHR